MTLVGRDLGMRGDHGIGILDDQGRGIGTRGGLNLLETTEIGETGDAGVALGIAIVAPRVAKNLVAKASDVREVAVAAVTFPRQQTTPRRTTRQNQKKRRQTTMTKRSEKESLKKPEIGTLFKHQQRRRRKFYLWSIS